MDWMIYGTELLVMIVCFTLMVTIPITINPVSFISDFPPEIQEAYYRSQNVEKKKEALKKVMIVKKAAVLIAALFLCAWDGAYCRRQDLLAGDFAGLFLCGSDCGI